MIQMVTAYDIKLVFVQKTFEHLFLGKSTKTAATRAAHFDSQYAPNRSSVGAYSAPRDALAVFRGRGRDGEKRGGEMMRRETREG